MVRKFCTEPASGCIGDITCSILTELSSSLSEDASKSASLWDSPL